MPLDDQIAQRQANFEAIRDLGVPVYPNHFDATDSVSALVTRHGAETAEALELARAYSGEEAVAFVNGVLDGVRKELKRE